MTNILTRVSNSKVVESCSSAEVDTDEHKRVMIIKRPLFPICFSFFYRTGNTYDKFVISYLVPLTTL